MKRIKPKKLRDRRAGQSPYARSSKIEIRYDNVPLHRLGQGQVFNTENLERWNARHGIYSRP